MKVIDRVKTHFESLATLTIEVEEWKDENGKPSIFYSEPLTLEEKNNLNQILTTQIFSLIFISFRFVIFHRNFIPFFYTDKNKQKV